MHGHGSWETVGNFNRSREAVIFITRLVIYFYKDTYFKVAITDTAIHMDTDSAFSFSRDTYFQRTLLVIIWVVSSQLHERWESASFSLGCDYHESWTLLVCLLTFLSPNYNSFFKEIIPTNQWYPNLNAR